MRTAKRIQRGINGLFSRKRTLRAVYRSGALPLGVRVKDRNDNIYHTWFTKYSADGEPVFQLIAGNGNIVNINESELGDYRLVK